MSPRASSAAPLLYWLLIVCGLAGLTLQRLDTPGDLLPLWLGTVVGVALGQLVAWLRVRPWVLTATAMIGFWFSPVLFFVLYQSILGPAETAVFAFLPAAACGYLSLSERGGLVAFWYPAVLWMLVILDGPGSGAVDTRAALPVLIGLAALFVAFLRARETRRVAIWHAHATVRLAAPKPRAVLRASPLRAASELAWTGFVGAAALVLAAWIAPHLWQKEHGKPPKVAAAQPSETLGSGAPGQEEPCCPNVATEEKRAAVREYFPLFHGQDEVERRPMAACAVCRDGRPVTTASSDQSSGGDYGATSGGGSVGDLTTPSTSYAPSTVGPAEPPLPSPTQPLLPSGTTKPLQPLPPKRVTAPALPGAVPARVATAPSPVSSPAGHSVKPANIALVLKPAAPPPDAGAPWKSMLAFCVGGLALHVVVRAIRRQLMLRHLARPFWTETLDQRISNHWQRMLIGLRDAGIHPAPHEQPEALAKRVGIEGMAACATILERVRHGVRVDAADLETMDGAAGAVYRAARAKAGASGRAAAWLRWPLA